MGDDSAIVPSPPLAAPGLTGLRPSTPRRGRTGWARGPEARSPRAGAGSYRARRTAASGTTNLTFTAAGVAPEAMAARGRSDGLGRGGDVERRSEAVSGAGPGADQRGPGGGCGSSSSSPGQLDWLLVWALPRHPPPQFEVPGSRPVCRPFWFSVDFFSTPSYN